MNSSSYTERIRNETLYYARLQNKRHEQKGGTTVDIVNARMEGGISLYRLGILPEAPPPSGPPLTCQELLLTTLQAILQHIANTNPGPTRTARQLYLLSFTLTSLYSHCCFEQGPITGVKDGWDWSIRQPLQNSTELLCWMLHGITSVILTFLPSFDIPALWERERTVNGWTLEKQEQIRNEVRVKGNWNTWKARWDTWLANRMEDGFLAAGIPLSSTELPNRSSVLDVTLTVDPSTFSEPTKWTPLVVLNKTQKYLGSFELEKDARIAYLEAKKLYHN